MSSPIQKIAGIQKTYRHASRYSEIISILFKYGFGDVVEALNIQKYVLIAMPMSWREEWEKRRSLSAAQRFRRALEELGPSFVKFGQILSSHPEIVPPDWIEELQNLQENVRAFPFEDAERILARELGSDWRSKFAHFEEKPLAAASIGQVHRGTLTDGDEVVVKIQRPNIDRTIEVDLEIMLHIATLMEREGYASWHPTDMVEEFGRVIARETDYTIESGQQERFATNFQADPGVYVPRVYHELLTSRVMTMEFVEGIRPTSATVLKEAGLDPREVARSGFEHILKQIFIHGFFHADPHPGNLRVLQDNVVCYLDFGMVGRMNRGEREDFADLVVAIASRDSRTCTRAFMRLAEYDAVPDRDDVERAVDEMLTQHLQRSLKELDLGRLLEGIIEVVSEFNMRIPEDLLMMIKSLSTIEGIGRSLDPEFDPISQAAPFLKEYQVQRRNPERLIREAVERAQDLLRFIEEIPDQMRELTRILRTGEMKMHFQHDGLEPMLRTFDRASRRLALAMLVGALLISSSVIVLADIPQIGMIGFVVAGVVSVWLIISLLRQGWK